MFVGLILLRGAHVKDPNGIPEGNYADGRRLLVIRSLEDLQQKEKDLKRITKELIKNM